ncbi:MAG TPA: ribosome silencing factor [Bacteroidia bacterium]
MAEKLKSAKKKTTTSSSLVRYAIKGIEEKKGNEIVCINLKKISNNACDYFIICEGTSRTHVQAIAESVEEFVKKHTGNNPWHVEGRQNAEWVLLDYVDVAVHVFQPEARSHYNLENMWADAEIVDMKEMDAPAKPKAKTKSKAKAKNKKTSTLKRRTKRKK